MKDKLSYTICLDATDELSINKLPLNNTDIVNQIKEETKATIRCIPLDNPQEEGKCIYTGKPSRQRVIFARNY